MGTAWEEKKSDKAILGIALLVFFNFFVIFVQKPNMYINAYIKNT